MHLMMPPRAGELELKGTIWTQPLLNLAPFISPIEEAQTAGQDRAGSSTPPKPS